MVSVMWRHDKSPNFTMKSDEIRSARDNKSWQLMDHRPSPPYRVLLLGGKASGSQSKKHKLSKEQDVRQCEDRISNLPSNLIGQILSSLPTKNAVATSILSTRWKPFWTQVTCLDFDDKLLLQSRISNRAALQTCFVSFVYRVLERVSCLDKFRLKCYQSYDASHMYTWVAAVIKYHVKELDLSIPMKHSADLVLPEDLFSRRTLVALKLGTEFMLNVPVSVCLPSLKILHLNSVNFSDDDSIKRFLLGCPMLDELSMNQCGGDDVRVFHISAHVLTKLRFCKQKDPYYDEVSEYKIMIDTPALLYLELFGDVAEVNLVKDLSHIVKADIGIAAKFDEIHSITDLLKRISEVQCLHLNDDYPEVFDQVECSCMKAVHNLDSELPMFHNLTSLVLGAGYVGRQWLPQLLEKSPWLESLVFEEGYQTLEFDEDVEDDDDKPFFLCPHQNVPSCLLLNLKVIKFVNFEANDGNLGMVEYFLKNAEVLQKLTIQIDGRYCEGFNPAANGLEVAEQLLEVTMKLLMLPRGSKTCQIEFDILRNDLYG